MGQFKYKAFISYSHKDEKWCSWLHRRLENYKIPKPLIGRETELGPIPANLKPVFRDKDELSAGSDLGEHIQAALHGSEFLIVLCSPNSAKSHWVNEEIIYFKHNFPDRQIFSIIVDGIPFVSDGPETADQECFPPALRFQIDGSGRLTDKPAEPLAADVSERGDGKRLGSLRLISGMIGVGLDDLVQRDMKKERRRVTIITSTALTTVLIMSGLTWAAMSARGAAERAQAEAEMRRAEAEGLTEFMLTDLKDKMVPLGKLDVMDGVADKVIEYYENYPDGEIDCAASSRHAQSLHLAAEIADNIGSIDAFSKYAENAYRITQHNLAACDDNEQALFDHGQSAFWQGYVAFNRQDQNAFLRYSAEYVAQLTELYEAYPHNVAYKREYALAIVNEGVGAEQRKEPDVALQKFDQAEALYRGMDADKVLSPDANLEFAEILGWKARVLTKQNKIQSAVSYREMEIEKIRETLDVDPEVTWKAKAALGNAHRALAQLKDAVGENKEFYDNAIAARDLFETLKQNDPKNEYWSRQLVRSQIEVMKAVKRQGKNRAFVNEDLAMKLMLEDTIIDTKAREYYENLRLAIVEE